MVHKKRPQNPIISSCSWVSRSWLGSAGQFCFGPWVRWAGSAPHVLHLPWASGYLGHVQLEAPVGGPEAKSNCASAGKALLTGPLLTFHWPKPVTWPSSTMRLRSAFHPQWEPCRVTWCSQVSEKLLYILIVLFCKSLCSLNALYHSSWPIGVDLSVLINICI